MFPLVLVWIIAVLLIVGVVLWGLSQFPIDPTIIRMARAVVIVVAAIWIICLLVGLIPGAHPPAYWR